LGITKQQAKRIDDPLELFDLFYATYRQLSRERLREFMAGWPDIEELKAKETSELAIRYCEGLVYATIADATWARRRSSSTSQLSGPGRPQAGRRSNLSARHQARKGQGFGLVSVHECHGRLRWVLKPILQGRCGTSRMTLGVAPPPVSLVIVG